MIRVMFVCLGNICRSPMAEFIFRKMAENAGMGSLFFIASAGTSNEEEGKGVYSLAARELRKHGISCEGKRAAVLRKEDFDKYDYFLCMDENNLRSVHRLFGCNEKQRLLLSFTGRDGEVADPWYTGDFAAAYRDIEVGCAAFFRFAIKEQQKALQN